MTKLLVICIKTDTQTDSSISPKTSVLSGYNNSAGNFQIKLQKNRVRFSFSILWSVPFFLQRNNNLSCNMEECHMPLTEILKYYFRHIVTPSKTI